MRSQDQHLSADELESLGRGKGLSGELGDQLRPAREHAESCPACRRRLEVYPTSGAKLEKLRVPRGDQKGPECPSIDVWLQLAGGLLTATEQKQQTTHAAQCDYCGPILREIIQDFSQPASPEEEALIAGLDVSGQYQHRPALAEVLGGKTPRPIKLVSRDAKWTRFPVWAASAVGLAACAVLALVLFRVGPFKKEDTIASVTQLLGKAYGEQRNTEMRIPEGKYGPVRVSRAGPGSQFNSPPTLSEAEGIIAPALETHPNDPELLRRKAEAELLRGNYSDAMTTLNTVLDQGHPSSAVLQDLGIAYFQSAEGSSFGENRKIDYEKACQYMSQALTIAPYNSEILFNRAIIDERLQLLDQAIGDWNQFLKSEHDPQWRSEGSKYLQGVQEKKNLAP